MSTDAPARSIAELTARLDALGSIDTDDARKLVNDARSTIDPEGLSADLSAEALAFTFRDRVDVEDVVSYFGPIFSGTREDGTPFETPSGADVTEAVLAYWSRRSTEAQHPVIRARYADLVWVFSKRAGGRAPIAAIRTAIDAYLSAIETGALRRPIHNIHAVRRALQLASSVSDDDRVERVRQSILELEDRVADDHKLGLWGFPTTLPCR